LIETKLLARLNFHARDWGVVVESSFETETSVIAFGSRDLQPVVLKVIKHPGDEWHSGEILKSFDGNGVARVYECIAGAVLMERLLPGYSLAGMSMNGKDEDATDILVDVIERMSSIESLKPSTALHASPMPDQAMQRCPTVHTWAKGFERYIANPDVQIPVDLVKAGQRVYLDLCATQPRTRLLHGDLQHYNVLFDSNRGWLAIDPKGVIGEVEYELGAALRNPFERPELFLSMIEKRLRQFTDKLNLDYERALGWAFAQAVLSAIWMFEDGFVVDGNNGSLRLARAIQNFAGRLFEVRS
jgi:streptomycin 6-kinase